MKNLIKLFDAPPTMMHSAPFWAWNAKLEENSLRQQIRTMHEMGFGGFFMHSRTGLDTPYLSEDWFKAIDVCIDEAEKLGMLAYLYDEDRWPSGAAGGFVTSDDRFKARRLYCSADEVPSDGLWIASFAITLCDGKLTSMRRLNQNEKIRDGEKKFNFFRKIMETSTWYNNAAYLDTMNPEAVKRFIEVTHDQYAARYQDKFSKSVPAMFTDEPCYIHGDVNGCLPWTDDLCDKFKERFNYDLTERIPELFFATENEVSEVRHDFYDLCGSLFADNFCGLIADWGDRHNLPLCGHLLGEDALSSQTLYIGSAMRCYEKMQIPGIDVLTDRWNIFNTVKQLSSAANQLGKKYRMTETYGCTGWDFPLFGHKALGDWQYALGVNMRCLHLTYYSMAGEGKRDYPASFSDHSPWYQKYPQMEEYFARLGAVSLCTSEIRDLLVIHPLESVWSVLVKDIPLDETMQSNRQIQPGRKVLDFYDSPIVNELDRNHTDLTNLLLRENLDFDFGDEEMMSRIAEVCHDKIRVGEAIYRQILIPELKTVRSSTLKLLAQFKGKIFYLGNPPRFVDARLSNEAEKIYKNFIQVSWDDLAGKISADFRRISIADTDGRECAPVLYRLGKCNDTYTIFIVNSSMDFTTDYKNAPKIRDRRQSCPALTVTLNVPFAGNIAEFDLNTGEKTPISYRYENGRYIFNTSFDIFGSRLFVIDKSLGAFEHKAEKIKTAQKKTPIADKGFNYRLSEPNIFVLDHAAWQTPYSSSDTPEYILNLDDKLRSMLGEAPRGGKMEQPWHRQDNGKLPEMPIKLFYTFICAKTPENNCILTLENPEKFRIFVNDTELEQQRCGCYLDRALINLHLDKSLFFKGKNTIILECPHFNRRTELEALFIRGNFGVNCSNEIDSLPHELHFGDWGKQKLANYAGNITYFFDLDLKKDAAITFPEWYGTLLGVKIENESEKLLLTYPFTVNIPQGKYRLQVTVYGHRRNAFGPFYLNEKYPERTGPYQFKVYEHPERQLVQCGLLHPPLIIE